MVPFKAVTKKTQSRSYPQNGYSYIIEEKKINECLSKTGMPYISSDAPIEIQVPDKYMKLDNPKRANIMTLMKDKLNQL